jgi:hypothetical protein
MGSRTPGTAGEQRAAAWGKNLTLIDRDKGTRIIQPAAYGGQPEGSNAAHESSPVELEDGHDPDLVQIRTWPRRRK